MWPHERAINGVRVGGGLDILEDWLEAIDAPHCTSAALFDLHGVVDTMDWEQAAAVGVALEHYDDNLSILCSFAGSRRRRNIEMDQPWKPMLRELSGMAFTTVRDNRSRPVSAARESWMHRHQIVINGDKGQVGLLLSVPALLFDDHERRIDNFVGQSEQHGGFVVKRGPNYFHRQRNGYYYCNDTGDWIDAISSFRTLRGVRTVDSWGQER